MERTTHVPTQQTTRLKTLLDVLPDVLRAVLRETQPRVRRVVQFAGNQFQGQVEVKVENGKEGEVRVGGLRASALSGSPPRC